MLTIRCLAYSKSSIAIIVKFLNLLFTKKFPPVSFLHQYFGKFSGLVFRKTVNSLKNILINHMFDLFFKYINNLV